MDNISFLSIFILGILLLLIIVLAIIIACKPKKTEAHQEERPQAAPLSDRQPETELSIVQKAFGLLQRRITEQLSLQYPGARWVWASPGAIKRFENNEPLIVLLNSAGGYNKAQIVVHNMFFKGLNFISLEPKSVQPVIPVEPSITEAAEETDDADDIDDVEESENSEVIIPDDAPINYGRLAFEWCDANISDINAKFNEAIAQNQTEMLIPAGELPHPDSWTDLCAELKRNGFSVADFCEDGIKVNITN